MGIHTVVASRGEIPVLMTTITDFLILDVYLKVSFVSLLPFGI